MSPCAFPPAFTERHTPMAQGDQGVRGSAGPEKGSVRVLKTWRSEFRAGQELKRRIALERWEQEKRWREEDRAARQKALQDNVVNLAEHNANLKTAAGVSYLTLVCHEDTWTFMATEAYGIWKPQWTQSEPGVAYFCPDWSEAGKFTASPNLPPRRITQQDNWIADDPFVWAQLGATARHAARGERG